MKDLSAVGRMPERRALDRALSGGERAGGPSFPSPPSPQLVRCLWKPQMLHPPCWWLSPEMLPCTPTSPSSTLGEAAVRLCCLFRQREPTPNAQSSLLVVQPHAMLYCTPAHPTQTAQQHLHSYRAGKGQAPPTMILALVPLLGSQRASADRDQPLLTAERQLHP